jgi:hypothetical protein
LDNATITVMDITGRVISRQTFSTLEKTILQIDQKAGMYIVAIDAEKYNSRQFLIVED